MRASGHELRGMGNPRKGRDLRRRDGWGCRCTDGKNGRHFDKLSAWAEKMAGEYPLLVILGPTASGKSALAMAVARACGAEILSVDSMQIYQGMDIGTAKPTARQRQEIRHHLLDVARPDEKFSAAKFVEMAERTIVEGNSRGAKLIATGGTPMYFKALFEGLFAGPSADEAVRQRLRSLSGKELHERLKRVDPAAAKRIHEGDIMHLVRAWKCMN